MTNKPKPFREPDFTKLYQALCNYIENLEDKEDGGAYEDNFKEEIFEQAMIAVYGEDVFDYVNERIDEFESE